MCCLYAYMYDSLGPRMTRMLRTPSGRLLMQTLMARLWGAVCLLVSALEVHEVHE